MTAKGGPAHVVVDGSNIATEGRSLPSLAQLNDAVVSYMTEHPDAAVTVVVDATFGHRIEKKEVPEFEEGISNNELVSPPAGAVGRGDAFVLGIADKADATVLSNDSFQEFHADYEWLFDEGRLVGGKPVPHVGWVFVDRVPVRGPVSRQATGVSKRGRSQAKTGSRSRPKSGSKSGSRGRSSKASNQPMPVPPGPPPGATAASDAASEAGSVAARPAPKGGEPVNELLPFLEFVEHHPVGTSVNGTVDAYSSHGAYITIGDEGVRGYIPLRLMSDPPPRSARKEMKLGESVTAVVASFAAARRSIDCALPDMAAQAIAEAADARESEEPPAEKATAKRAAKKAAAKKTTAKKTAAKKTTAKKTAAKKTAAKKTTAKKTTAPRTAAKAPATKTTATRATAKKTAAKKTAAKKVPEKKAGTTTASTAKKSGTTKKTAAKKTPAKKTAAKKGPAPKTGTKKAATTKRAATKKAATTKPPDADRG
jgi:hypothetical protein